MDKIRLYLVVFVTVLLTAGCKSSSTTTNNTTLGLTINGTITLPVDLTGKQYLMAIDIDYRDSTGLTKFVQGTVTGTSITYRFAEVPAGNYFVYCVVDTDGSGLGLESANSGDYIATTSSTTAVQYDKDTQVNLTATAL